MAITDIWAKPFGKALPQITDDLVRQAETRLGVKLPESYLTLLRTQNGGYLKLTAIPTSVKNSSGDGFILMEELFGLDMDEDNIYSILCTPYMTKEWELPEHLVLLEGDGSWWIALDYRVKAEDPPVAYIDVEVAQDFQVAENFQQLIDSLVDIGKFMTDR